MTGHGWGVAMATVVQGQGRGEQLRPQTELPLRGAPGPGFRGPAGGLGRASAPSH